MRTAASSRSSEFYDLLWSERILDEAERNLVADGRVDESGARRLRNAMTTAFDDAIVPGEAIAGLEEAMTNDPKDRHVLATAVASEAQAVITMNLRDFPAASTEPYGIEAQHPDEFLMVLHAMDPDFAVALVRKQRPGTAGRVNAVTDDLPRDRARRRTHCAGAGERRRKPHPLTSPCPW